MKLHKMKIIVIIVFTVMIAGCYYDNEATLLGPGAACKTTSISYKSDIIPIIDANCNSCHSTAANLGNVILDNYQSIKIYAVSGALAGTTQQNGNYSPMPKNSAKMNTCNVSMIATWISEGALNN
jgi:hypothetical protein